MGGSDFSITLWVSLFLFSIWFGGRFFGFIKLPPILGYMLIGVIFGPNLLDVVPFASNGLCDSVINPQPDASGSASGSGRMLAGAASMTCQDVPWERWDTVASRELYGSTYMKSIWRFLGETGVTMMIFESGMHIHFDKVAQVGAKALVVAIFGTLLPLAFGMVLTGALFDGEYFPSGFAAGCSFAPTSVGISIFLLEDSKMLNTMAGQTIITSAFIDDVFSLLTLVLMQNLAISPTIEAKTIIVPIVGSVAILGGSVFFAIKVFNHLPYIFDKMPTAKYASIAPRDELQLFLMVFSLAGLGLLSWVPGFVGSHLLGAFGAGMLFVNVPRSQALWQSQFKRIVRWLVRIFFAATIGFSVPIQQMMTGVAFGRACLPAAILNPQPSRPQPPNWPRRHPASHHTPPSPPTPRPHPLALAPMPAVTLGPLPPRLDSSLRLPAGGMLLGAGPVIGAKIISGLFAPTKYSWSQSYTSDKVRDQARRASWATKLVQPQQLLVGMAMVARGEFAYLVAESASTLPVGGDDSRRMMSLEVYASVMWALVCATIFSPISFRWALAVYERAFPMERAVTITTATKNVNLRWMSGSAINDQVSASADEPASAAVANSQSPASQRGSTSGDVALGILPPGGMVPGMDKRKSDWHTDDDLSHSFGLRIAGRFHWGIHREIVACLYSLGVYVIEARIYPIDDPRTKKIDYFVSSYHVIARGKKLDFDEDKLHEMHHELIQVVRDDDAQVLPPSRSHTHPSSLSSSLSQPPLSQFGSAHTSSPLLLPPRCSLSPRSPPSPLPPSSKYGSRVSQKASSPPSTRSSPRAVRNADRARHETPIDCTACPCPAPFELASCTLATDVGALDPRAQA